MGIFRKRTIKIIILGQKWRVTFWHPTAYLKRVSDDSKAQIDYDERTLCVDLQYISPELLRHELTHAYAKERSIVETGIESLEQLEDFFCEIAGKHGEEIVKQARKLSKEGKKIRWS